MLRSYISTAGFASTPESTPTMLLKFTSPDMLNTSLVDVATGERAFEISTTLHETSESTDTPSSESSSFNGTSVLLSPSDPETSSPLWKHPEPTESLSSKPEQRQTKITDASGKVLVDVVWKGRRPDIHICGEKIGGLTELFGSTTIRFMPKVLAIPTRFDTEYIWTATAESLCLFDYDTETIKGSFHQNCIRIPAPLKPSKSKVTSPTKTSPSPFTLKRKTSLSTRLHLFSAPKSNVSSPSPSISPVNEEESSKLCSTPRSTFIPTHLPGIGSNYLEFTSHPLAQDVEIILSFLMMEILRRGRFCLTPYTFDRPTMWQFKEARDIFMRRLRRNTV